MSFNGADVALGVDARCSNDDDDGGGAFVRERCAGGDAVQLPTLSVDNVISLGDAMGMLVLLLVLVFVGLEMERFEVLIVVLVVVAVVVVLVVLAVLVWKE